MKIIKSQTSMHSLRKIVESSTLSANRRIATFSQSGRLSVSLGAHTSTQDHRLREREVMGEEVCDPCHYGYRTVSPSRSRSFVTSANIFAENLSWLSSGNTAASQNSYQDEYSFIMASHFPVSSAQCDKIRSANAPKSEVATGEDLKNTAVVHGLADASVGGPQLKREY